MKNSAINQLNYTGIVTLSQYKGSKKCTIARLHNEGRSSLFSFLADCLIGDFDLARTNRPAKIKLLKQKPDNTNGVTYESRSTYIQYTGTPEKLLDVATNACIVKYNFVIPSDKVTSIDFDFDHIGLYAQSTSNLDYEEFLAIVSLDDNDAAIDKDGVSNSAALIIDWELHLTNTEKETTDNV
jgi:hypothetical protein